MTEVKTKINNTSISTKLVPKGTICLEQRLKDEALKAKNVATFQPPLLLDRGLAAKSKEN